MSSKKSLVAVAAVATLVLAAPTLAQNGKSMQDGKSMTEKGVVRQKLVTSLGGFKGKSEFPIEISGGVVTIEPGGQTGRERALVPSYVYVLEGTLTTDTQGGPTGVSGFQYHAAGQSYMDPVGIWYNHMNGGTTPVKYLQLYVAAPGEPTSEKAKAPE